jgi:hypothetical protein
MSATSPRLEPCPEDRKLIRLRAAKLLEAMDSEIENCALVFAEWIIERNGRCTAAANAELNPSPRGSDRLHHRR